MAVKLFVDFSHIGLPAAYSSIPIVVDKNLKAIRVFSILGFHVAFGPKEKMEGEIFDE